MIEELLGKDVTILMNYAGTLDMVKGRIVEIREPWLKLTMKKGRDHVRQHQPDQSGHPAVAAALEARIVRSRRSAARARAITVRVDRGRTLAMRPLIVAMAALTLPAGGNG